MKEFLLYWWFGDAWGMLQKYVGVLLDKYMYVQLYFMYLYMWFSHRKLTWQWKIRHSTMHFLLKMVIFQLVMMLVFQGCTGFVFRERGVQMGEKNEHLSYHSLTNLEVKPSYPPILPHSSPSTHLPWCFLEGIRSHEMKITHENSPPFGRICCDCFFSNHRTFVANQSLENL